MKVIRQDYAPWGWDLDDDYHQRFFNWRERGATGFENDPILR